jgi:hypothetical protein
MNRELIERLLLSYIAYTNVQKEINKVLLNENKHARAIRRANFPSEISENIVRIILSERGVNADWNTKSGDLQGDDGSAIEIKAFSSNGPTSFGPTENWDSLYVIDCSKYESRKFVLYHIPLSNKAEEWRSLKVSKRETFGQSCDKGKRPRLSFKELKKQLGSLVSVIFDETF